MQPTPTQPLIQTLQPEEGSPNMTFIGIAIGAMMALTIVGLMYYKSKLEKMNTATPAKKIVSPVAQSATPVPFELKGTPTPVPISSTQDLSTQQTVLDGLDMSSIAKDLEATTTESAQFAL